MSVWCFEGGTMICTVHDNQPSPEYDESEITVIQDEVNELRTIILTLVKIVAKRPFARLDWETIVEIERKLNES